MPSPTGKSITGEQMWGQVAAGRAKASAAIRMGYGVI
jgi:hypothetical protein